MRSLKRGFVQPSGRFLRGKSVEFEGNLVPLLKSPQVSFFEGRLEEPFVFSPEEHKYDPSKALPRFGFKEKNDQKAMILSILICGLKCLKSLSFPSLHIHIHSKKCKDHLYSLHTKRELKKTPGPPGKQRQKTLKGRMK